MQVTAEIPVFGYPRVMVASPDGKFAYLTQRWLNGMVKVDLEQNKIVGWTQLPPAAGFDNEGKVAHGLAVSPDGKLVYLSSQLANNVSVIDVQKNRVVKTFKVGKNPNWIELTEDGKYAVVSNTSSNDTTLVDLKKNKAIGTIPAGKSPKRLAIGSRIKK